VTAKYDVNEVVNGLVAKNETEFENYNKSQETIWSTDLLKAKFVLQEKKEQLKEQCVTATTALFTLNMNNEMRVAINRCKDRHPEKKEQLETLLQSYISKEPLPQQYRKDGIKRSSILGLKVNQDSVIPSYDKCVKMIENSKGKKSDQTTFKWNDKKEYARNIDMLMLIKDITQNSDNPEDIALLRTFEEPVEIAAKKHEQKLDYEKKLQRDKNKVDGETVVSRVDNATGMMGSISLVDSKVSNKVVDGIKDELDKGDGKKLSEQEMQAIASDIRGLLDDSMANSTSSFKQANNGGD